MFAKVLDENFLTISQFWAKFSLAKLLQQVFFIIKS